MHDMCLPETMCRKHISCDITIHTTDNELRSPSVACGYVSWAVPIHLTHRGTEIVRELCIREFRERKKVFTNSLFTNIFATNMKIVELVRCVRVKAQRKTIYRIPGIIPLVSYKNGSVI